MQSTAADLGVDPIPFVCSPTVCLECHETRLPNVFTSDYARVVVDNGDFKVQRWLQSESRMNGGRLIDPKHTIALQTSIMAKLAKKGITADQVRKQLLANQSENK